MLVALFLMTWGDVMRLFVTRMSKNVASKKEAMRVSNKEIISLWDKWLLSEPTRINKPFYVVKGYSSKIQHNISIYDFVWLLSCCSFVILEYFFILFYFLGCLPSISAILFCILHYLLMMIYIYIFFNSLLFLHFISFTLHFSHQTFMHAETFYEVRYVWIALN